jgi:hypothetical protein
MTHCPHCSQPISRDGVCSFCVPPRRRGYSATQAVCRYFDLISRSSAPALDPSQEDARGGAVGPVAYCLHERARLRSVLDAALGDGWLECEMGRALMAEMSAGDWRWKNWIGKVGDEQRDRWRRLCREGLAAVRRELEARGLCRDYDEGDCKQEDIVGKREVVRGWENISEILGFSEKTVRDWYNGNADDPCNIRSIVRKINNRTIAAYREELEKARDALYGPKVTQTENGYHNLP